jgi:hypothetical protein
MLQPHGIAIGGDYLANAGDSEQGKKNERENYFAHREGL